MKDLFERLYEDVMQKAKERGVSRVETMKCFMESYERHKQINGSYKNHPRYGEVMKQRYEYIHSETVKFIDGHK